MKLRRALLWLLAPLGAVAFSLLVSSIALALIHKSPFTAYHQMISYGLQKNQIISILNRATPLFLSGLAVGIGFKMNLFNIGVEGQYIVGMMTATAAAGLVP